MRSSKNCAWSVSTATLPDSLILSSLEYKTRNLTAHAMPLLLHCTIFLKSMSKGLKMHNQADSNVETGETKGSRECFRGKFLTSQPSKQPRGNDAGMQGTAYWSFDMRVAKLGRGFETALSTAGGLDRGGRAEGELARWGFIVLRMATARNMVLYTSTGCWSPNRARKSAPVDANLHLYAGNLSVISKVSKQLEMSLQTNKNILPGHQGCTKACCKPKCHQQAQSTQIIRTDVWLWGST